MPIEGLKDKGVYEATEEEARDSSSDSNCSPDHSSQECSKGNTNGKCYNYREYSPNDRAKGTENTSKQDDEAGHGNSTNTCCNVWEPSLSAHGDDWSHKKESNTKDGWVLREPSDERVGGVFIATIGMCHGYNWVARVRAVNILDGSVSFSSDACIALDNGGELIFDFSSVSFCSADGFRGACDGDTNDVITVFDSVGFRWNIVRASEILTVVGSEVLFTSKVLADVPGKSVLGIEARGLVHGMEFEKGEIAGNYVASKVRSYS